MYHDRHLPKTRVSDPLRYTFIQSGADQKPFTWEDVVKKEDTFNRNEKKNERYHQTSLTNR